MEFTKANCGGSWSQIFAREPETICHPESLLVCALRTVGVRLHPAFGFQPLRDDAGLLWRWIVAQESSDGLYKTADLAKWWTDKDWLAANPRSEWAIVRNALLNMATQAGEIRDTKVKVVLRRGQGEAHIPEDASEALIDFTIGQLEGRIPLDQVFVEPAQEAAA